MQGPDDQDFEDPEFEQDESEDDVNLADDVADGLACSACGTYFTEAHSYPVLCKSCWANPVNHAEGLQEAIHPELTAGA